MLYVRNKDADSTISLSFLAYPFRRTLYSTWPSPLVNYNLNSGLVRHDVPLFTFFRKVHKEPSDSLILMHWELTIQLQAKYICSQEHFLMISGKFKISDGIAC